MRFLLTLLAFMAGFVVGYVAVVAAILIYIDWAGIFDRDGGMTMGVIFMIGPFAGVVAGLVSAALAARRLRRAASKAPAG